MGVLRAVLRAVGLLVVLLLALAVVGLAVAILAIMVTGALEEDRRPVRAPIPPRRTVPRTQADPIVPVIPELEAIPARGTAKEDQKAD